MLVDFVRPLCTMRCTTQAVSHYDLRQYCKVVPLAKGDRVCILQPMKRHVPSIRFRGLIADLGGCTAASEWLGIPRPTLYCIRNGHRRLSLDMAKLIAERSGNLYSASDLLGLNADQAA